MVYELRKVGTSRRNVMSPGGSIRLAFCLLLFSAATVMSARAEDFNDYPTATRAEYVFGCLKANGETRQAIRQCSSSLAVFSRLFFCCVSSFHATRTGGL